MPPHSLTMTMIGASLLWVGWFGFNAGSNLEANGTAALAMINTFVATAAAALAWLFVEWGAKGKPSLLGAVSGAIAGLVAVTPAAGFAGPMGSIVLGRRGRRRLLRVLLHGEERVRLRRQPRRVRHPRHRRHRRRAGTGILVNPALGGVGVDGLHHRSRPVSSIHSRRWRRSRPCLTLVWSGVGSVILYKIVDLIVGLRVSHDEEREGLDSADQVSCELTTTTAPNEKAPVRDRGLQYTNAVDRFGARPKDAGWTRLTRDLIFPKPSTMRRLTTRPNGASGPVASWPFALQQAAVDERLGDLDGVQGGALAEVVGDAPEGEPFSTVMSSRMRET